MKYIIACCIVLLCICSSQSEAKFGGSRSSSSYSSSSRSSSFGGNRSGGQPATINRPAPRQTIINNTTVIHDRNYRSNDGLVTGILVGHALSTPRQVVYVSDNQQQGIIYQAESRWYLWVIIPAIVVFAFFYSYN